MSKDNPSQFTGGLRELGDLGDTVKPLEPRKGPDAVERLRKRVEELNEIDSPLLTVNLATLKDLFARYVAAKELLERQGEAKIREALEPKKAKRESNPQRWSRLASEAEAKANELKDLLEELEGMRSECEEKRDNMNDGLQQTPYGQKLTEIADLDISTHVDAAEEAASACSDAGGMDWPRGFGRD